MSESETPEVTETPEGLPAAPPPLPEIHSAPVIPFELPSDLPPLMDAHGEEVAPEKLEQLTPEEIVPSVIQEPIDKLPADTRHFLEGLRQMREWLREETAEEHPGKLVGAHIKLLCNQIDAVDKVIRRIGLQH